jgi:hypothetical protein
MFTYFFEWLLKRTISTQIFLFDDNGNIVDDFIVFKTVNTPVYVRDPRKVVNQNSILRLESFNFLKSSKGEPRQGLIFE